MPANISRVRIPVGVDFAFANFLKDGYANGSSPTVLANGADIGSTWLRGLKTVTLAQQAWRPVNQTGDNGKLLFQAMLPPDSAPTGEMTVATMDLDFMAKAQGGALYTSGDWENFFISPTNQVLEPSTMIFNVPCQSDDVGSKGQAGYLVIWWFNVQSAPLPTAAGLTEAAPLDTTYNLIANPVDVWPSGRPFVLGEEGVCDAYGVIFFSPYPVTLHTLMGDGVVTDVVLDYTPAAEDVLKVPAWLEGVVEVYTTDYAVTQATKTIAIVVAPPAGERWVTPYQFLTTGIC